VDGWGVSIGARWAFDAPPARPRSSSPAMDMPATDRWSGYYTPAPRRGLTTASLSEPVDPAVSASPESTALRMLMDENRTLRRELDALREEVLARNALASLGVEPTDIGDPSPARQLMAPSPPADTFPLVPGERRVLDGVNLGLDNPVSDPHTRAALDVWGALLAAHPDVRVRVLVHGADADPARALAVTERQASILESYLEVMGAAPTQVVAIGLGRSGAGAGAGAAPSDTVEIERLR
jgi:hypothetical protein